MTHVSKKKLSEETLRQILDSLLFVLTDVNNKHSMGRFLDAFLTKTERVMLAKRLAIAYLLNEGLEETKIANLLGVMQNTVFLMKLKMQDKSAGYQEAFAKIKKQKLLEDLKILALKLGKYAIRAAGGRI
ncbi:hypothetical protein HZB97_01695 [Candidatus Gottesmanbacteria bacterium]|nr:hypothetical protein [Candidatus Gottesmanbacteria bacterium]